MVSNTRQTKNKRSNRLKKMGKKRKNMLNKKGLEKLIIAFQKVYRLYDTGFQVIECLSNFHPESVNSPHTQR